MLDIGCGIAGVEMFIEAEEFYLIDRTQSDKNIYYGHNHETSFYNSLEIAEKQIRINNPESKIFKHEADNTIIWETKFDRFILLALFVLLYCFDNIYNTMQGILCPAFSLKIIYYEL